jgi:hypothetical protein
MSTTPIEALKDEKGKPRAFKRFDMQFTVLLNPSYGHDSPLSQSPVSKIRAIVNDISVSGLSFRCAMELPLNALLLIEISIASNVFCVPVIVRRCTKYGHGGKVLYGCGVQYIGCEATTKFIPVLAKYLIVWGPH